MTRITPEALQKFEFYTIFLNNLLLFLGMAFLGWGLFDTLFLVWLELLAAVVVLQYLQIVVPLRYGRPGTLHLEEFRRPALKVLGLTIYTLILHYVVLVFMIRLGQVDSWETTQGVWTTLVQLPGQLWEQDLLLLALLFLVVYLAPLLMLERRGVVPSENILPMSARVMIHPSQFIAQYIWFFLLWLLHHLVGLQHPLALVGLVLLLKSGYEAWVFFRVKGQL